MIYQQGDIVEVSFDPTVGHEPAKTRSALVISADDFNIRSSLTVVAPITSIVNGYPFHVELSKNNEVHGCVCVEQLRSLDLQKRLTRHLGIIDPDDMTLVLERVRAIYGI